VEQQFGQAGPVFTQHSRADEINRTTKRRSGVAGGDERRPGHNGRPLASYAAIYGDRNPESIEPSGTYPLPAFQIDSFLLSLQWAISKKPARGEILRSEAGAAVGPNTPFWRRVKRIIARQEEVKLVEVDDSLWITGAGDRKRTRESESLALGVINARVPMPLPRHGPG